jgi:hypothetical protein
MLGLYNQSHSQGSASTFQSCVVSLHLLSRVQATISFHVQVKGSRNDEPTLAVEDQ